MAIKNTFTVYVNGHNLTAYAVLPLKWGDYLDESLDECYLSLRKCPVKVFKPLLPVEITITNTLQYTGKSDTVFPTVTKQYLVADTSEGRENPAGSGYFDHTLYLIEPTKYLECFIVDSLTYTNDIGRTYTDEE